MKGPDFTPDLSTKLVDPDVTSAFELGSADGFTSQQCIPDQLGIGLGVDHGLQEFFFEPIGQMLSISFNKRCGMLPVCRQNSWGNSQSSIWSEACELVCRRMVLSSPSSRFSPRQRNNGAVAASSMRIIA